MIYTQRPTFPVFHSPSMIKIFHPFTHSVSMYWSPTMCPSTTLLKEVTDLLKILTVSWERQRLTVSYIHGRYSLGRKAKPLVKTRRDKSGLRYRKKLLPRISTLASNYRGFSVYQVPQHCKARLFFFFNDITATVMLEVGSNISSVLERRGTKLCYYSRSHS